MNLLTVSIGNTTVQGAVFGKKRRLHRLRLPHGGKAGGATRALAQEIANLDVGRAVLCSVVPALTPSVSRLLAKATGWPVPVLSAASPHGLRIDYRDPARLGTDRLAAVLGARSLRPGRNLIVVDCGTASTVTALDDKNVLRGGAIIPGLGLWSEALASKTAQLPAVLASRPKKALGRSPEEAITSGLYHGHLGALERLVITVAGESFGLEPFDVLCTGGNAALFRREKLFTHIEPDLIVLGLAAFAANLRQDA